MDFLEMKLHVALKNTMGFLLGCVFLVFNSECHNLHNLAFAQWSFNLHHFVNIKNKFTVQSSELEAAVGVLG